MDKQRSGDNGKQIWKPTRASRDRREAEIQQQNYDRIYPYVKKGKKSVYQRAAKASGFDSINDMIESLMDEWAAAVLGLSPEQFAAEVQAAADAEQEKA